MMEAFSPTPPTWTENAIHSLDFYCPRCGNDAHKAQRVWINRRAPVIGENSQRRWQEFYYCECGEAWWAWSSDRPPSEFAQRENS